jgi:hypothetical protein
MQKLDLHVGLYRGNDGMYSFREYAMAFKAVGIFSRLTNRNGAAARAA